MNIKRKSSNLIEILYHTDAAQAFGKVEVDAATLNVDYITIVGHKVSSCFLIVHLKSE